MKSCSVCWLCLEVKFIHRLSVCLSVYFFLTFVRSRKPFNFYNSILIWQFGQNRYLLYKDAMSHKQLVRIDLNWYFLQLKYCLLEKCSTRTNFLLCSFHIFLGKLNISLFVWNVNLFAYVDIFEYIWRESFRVFQLNKCGRFVDISM